MTQISKEDKLAEIDRNYEAFLAMELTLKDKRKDEYAILRDKVLVSIHADLDAACKTASELFPDQRYSIQQIDPKPAEFGIYSYAYNQRPA